MDVFTLGEVAEILRVPISRIKNWTIGRPFKIVPRVMAALGKGSRNLFSLEDIYMFALIDQLHEDGLSSPVIQSVLEGAYLVPKLGPVRALHLTRKQGKWSAMFGTGDVRYENVQKKRARVHPYRHPGSYSLNVRALVAWVNYRVSQFRGRA